MNFLINRIPSPAKLAPVYAVTVTIIYGWSAFILFWRLASFLNYSTISDIGGIFVYQITVNFLESLAVFSAPFILSVILPQKWFYERFVTKGALLVSLSLGYLAYINSKIVPEAVFPYELFRWSPLVFVTILIFVLFIGQINFVAKIIDDLADRLVVFLYIAMPISAIAILIVLLRNIF